jgi:hypothetical protein
VIASNFQLALDGVDVTVAQNTPTAKTKENRDIHFNCNVELQTTLEKLPEGIVHCSTITCNYHLHNSINYFNYKKVKVSIYFFQEQQYFSNLNILSQRRNELVLSVGRLWKWMK